MQPIFGGAFGSTGRSAWRLTFYFMGALGGASFLSFLFFKETFRTERSLAWQKARKEALERAAMKERVNEEVGRKNAIITFWHNIKSHTLNIWKRVSSSNKREVSAVCIAEGEKTTSKNEPFMPPLYQDPNQVIDRTTSAPVGMMVTTRSKSQLGRSKTSWADVDKTKHPALARKVPTRRSINRVITSEGKEIKVSVVVVVLRLPYPS